MLKTRGGQTDMQRLFISPQLRVCPCARVRVVGHSVTQSLSVSEPCLPGGSPPTAALCCLLRWLTAGRTGADPCRPVPCSLFNTHGRLIGRTGRCHGGHSCPAAASVTPRSVDGGEERVRISDYFWADGGFISVSCVSAKLWRYWLDLIPPPLYTQPFGQSASSCARTCGIKVR